MSRIIALCLVTFFVSCSPKLSNALDSPELFLSHVVTLDLKKDIGEESYTLVLKELNSLCSLPSVLDCFVASAYDTGDKRLVKDYDLILQMKFVDEASLKAYDEHEEHAAVRKRLGPFLAGPPRVYDAYLER